MDSNLVFTLLSTSAAALESSIGNPLFVVANCMFGTRSVAIIPENSPIVLLLKPPEDKVGRDNGLSIVQFIESVREFLTPRRITRNKFALLTRTVAK